MMKSYVVQHTDSESSISCYFSVEAMSREDAVVKAEQYVIDEEFTDGSLAPPMEATQDEITVLEKFGILI